jgi:putative ABC transport system permease protein
MKQAPMKLFRRLRYWMRSRQNQADLVEEMAFHQEMLGDAPAMGNRTLAREDARAVWIWPWLESVLQDVRYALRNLRHQPGLALIAIFALGCAIGLNTSLFTVFNAVAIRTWPVHDAGRVVNILQRRERSGPIGFSLEEFRYLAANSKTVPGILSMRGGQAVKAEKLDNAKAVASWVSGSYFDVLGIGMQQGRGFRADEDLVDAPQAVVVVSYAFWQNHLGSDPSAVGQQMRIEDVPFTIVGVTGNDFSGTAPEAVDLYVPMSAAPILQPHAAWLKSFLHSPDHCCSDIAGRLAPGVSRAQAVAELAVLHQQFQAAHGQPAYGIELRGTAFIFGAKGGRKFLPIFALLFLGVMLVLLLACANVGNLLLARAAARQREISVRLSLGASRGRVIRQLLTESLVLACAAGLLGVAAAYWFPAIVFRAAVNENLSFRIVPDSVVLAYALALSVATCVIFGLAPALHGTRPSGLRSNFALRSALLTAQVALSVMLLVGAGLLTRGVEKARTNDPGFTISGVSLASFDLPASSYDGPRSHAFFTQLTGDLNRQAIGLTSVAPLGNSRTWTSLRVPGQSGKEERIVAVQQVNGGYFDVLGIPILEGRNFAEREAAGSFVVVNQELARRFFDGKALGKTLITDKPYEIGGIARDAFTSGLDELVPTIYFSIAGDTVPLALFRSTPGAADAIAAVVKQIDRRAGTTFTPLSDNLDRSLQASRAGAGIAEGLGVFALALATIGMFGVFAYWVERRTKEIGIRIALGARPEQVIGLVLRGSSRAMLIGLALGFLGAAGISRLLRNFLYGLSPFDPISYALVVAILAAAALLATFLPARRAAKIDPMAALRCE